MIIPRQINEELLEIEEKDQFYSRKELNDLFIFSLKDFIPNSNGVEIVGNKIQVNYKGENLLFYINNFLWVGKTNPTNKKRLLVSLSNEEEEKLHKKQLFLIGVYHFNLTHVYGFYEVDEKTSKRKWNGSSVMLIKTEELKDTLVSGYEKKNDKLGIIHLFKDRKDLLTHLFSITQNSKLKKIETSVPLVENKSIINNDDVSKFISLNTDEFNLEEEIHTTFENNLTTIFPNLTFLKRKFPIPRLKEFEDNEIIDTLAFHHQKLGFWNNFVLLEYKWWNKKESPIDQVLGYYEALRSDSGNFDSLKDVLEDYLEVRPDWKYNEDFWNKFVLICVVPFGYCESSKKMKRKLRSLNNVYRLKIIIIEVQKFDNGTILISVRNNGDGQHESHMKFLGLDFHNVIICPTSK